MQGLDVKRARKILIIQLAVALITAAIATVFGLTAGLSALIGGAAVTLSNALFALLVFARYRAQEADRLMMRFYGAELIKLITIVVIFAMVFIWVKPLNLLALFGAFFLVQVLPPLLAHRAD